MNCLHSNQQNSQLEEEVVATQSAYITFNAVFANTSICYRLAYPWGAKQAKTLLGWNRCKK